jgi:hypothetical protein
VLERPVKPRRRKPLGGRVLEQLAFALAGLLIMLLALGSLIVNWP